MNIFHKALGTLLLLLAAACVSAASRYAERFHITTRDWIDPKHRDIYANVNIERIDQNLYSLKFVFSVPLDPVRGVNPTEFHIFTYCLASHLTKQDNFSHWSLGAVDKNTKYRNTTEIELFVAAVAEKDGLPAKANGTTIQWLLAPMSTDSFYESCSKVLRPKYMWEKSQ